MYNMMFRWYRDGVPSMTDLEVNDEHMIFQDYLGPDGVVMPVLSPIRSEV